MEFRRARCRDQWPNRSWALSNGLGGMGLGPISSSFSIFFSHPCDFFMHPVSLSCWPISLVNSLFLHLIACFFLCLPVHSSLPLTFQTQNFLLSDFTSFLHSCREQERKGGDSSGGGGRRRRAGHDGGDRRRWRDRRRWEHGSAVMNSEQKIAAIGGCCWRRKGGDVVGWWRWRMRRWQVDGLRVATG